MQLLSHVLSQGELQISFPQLSESFSEVVEGRCYKALCNIKEIIDDDSLDDSECFQRIEEIIRVFEGFSSISRHDLG